MWNCINPDKCISDLGNIIWSGIWWMDSRYEHWLIDIGSGCTVSLIHSVNFNMAGAKIDYKRECHSTGCPYYDLYIVHGQWVGNKDELMATANYIRTEIEEAEDL